MFAVFAWQVTGVKQLLEKIIDSLDPIHALQLLRSTWLPTPPHTPSVRAAKRPWNAAWQATNLKPLTFFFFFFTLGLELSDTKVYEP